MKHSTDPSREKIDAKQREKVRQEGETSKFKGESHSYSFKGPKEKSCLGTRINKIEL